MRVKTTNRLIFDGDCGICTRSAQIARCIDRDELFEIVPFQQLSEGELRNFGLDYAKCDGEVQSITRDGRVYGGAFAVNYFLFKHQPWTILILLIYLVPILLLFEVVAYKVVASNRARVSRWLGLSACRVERQ